MPDGELASPATVDSPTGLSGAASDDRLFELWLHGKSPNTQRAYIADVAQFRHRVGGRALSTVTLADVQAFASTLSDASYSNARRLSALKSLFAFAHRIGYLQFDVARTVQGPRRKNTLAERILGELQVQKMIALESSPRNAILLRLLYGAGLRVSEAAALKWRDLQVREEGGQATVFGKGGKSRAVMLPRSLWDGLTSLRHTSAGNDPVFVSRKGGPLDPSAILRIVRSASRRAGLKEKVSPHWLRHAHASHALERGAPIQLVQATLGHASIATTGRYLHARPTDSSARYLNV